MLATDRRVNSNYIKNSLSTINENINEYVGWEVPLVNITWTIHNRIIERLFEIHYLAAFPPGLLPIMASYVAHSVCNASFELHK